MPAPWWQHAVVYQIYPRSFADTSGDGVGDLAGVRAHLDHLAWLGVDAIWLSPFQPSPMADFGYDISDYCGVDPVFGTLDDLDALVDDAHERGLRVLLDWVPNHTSNQHPWFVASRSSRQDPKRDWYIWRDSAPDGGPPNNWIRSWSDQPAWTFDEATGQWYLHCFLPEQPDLNWANPEVQAAMHDVLRFWLDRGIDGFRMDVVHLIGKDPDLADDPEDLAALSHVPLNDRPETHALLRGIRSVLDEYPGDRTSVGEVYLLDTARVASYYGAGDELHLAFNFAPLYVPWTSEAWRQQVEVAQRELGQREAWPTWVLSNHDVVRHRTRLGGDEQRARCAAVLLLGLRGTPFLYAGEELGLDDAVIPPQRVVDPGGRDGCRAPLPWDATPAHGWGTTEPWLPWPPGADVRNVASQRDDPDSILHLYRRMLAERAASPALQLGALTLLDAPDGCLVWRRHLDGDERVVVVGFTDRTCALPELVGATVVVASDGRDEGSAFDGRLTGERALVLRPPS